MIEDIVQWLCIHNSLCGAVDQQSILLSGLSYVPISMPSTSTLHSLQSTNQSDPLVSEYIGQLTMTPCQPQLSPSSSLYINEQSEISLLHDSVPSPAHQ